MPTDNKSAHRSFQIACFVKQTLKNLNIFNLLSNKMRKAANPHILEVGRRTYLAFLLKKDLTITWLLKYVLIIFLLIDLIN